MKQNGVVFTVNHSFSASRASFNAWRAHAAVLLPKGASSMMSSRICCTHFCAKAAPFLKSTATIVRDIGRPQRLSWRVLQQSSQTYNISGIFSAEHTRWSWKRKTLPAVFAMFHRPVQEQSNSPLSNSLWVTYYSVAQKVNSLRSCHFDIGFARLKMSVRWTSESFIPQ